MHCMLHGLSRVTQSMVELIRRRGSHDAGHKVVGVRAEEDEYEFQD